MAIILLNGQITTGSICPSFNTQWDTTFKIKLIETRNSLQKPVLCLVHDSTHCTNDEYGNMKLFYNFPYKTFSNIGNATDFEMISSIRIITSLYSINNETNYNCTVNLDSPYSGWNVSLYKYNEVTNGITQLMINPSDMFNIANTKVFIQHEGNEFLTNYIATFQIKCKDEIFNYEDSDIYKVCLCQH